MIGILGLGARSTEFYIHKLNQIYHTCKGDYHTFPYLLYSIDFNDINPYLPNNFEELIPRLKSIFVNLRKLPLNYLMVPNITLHETLDKLQTGIFLIHPIKLCIENLKAANKTSIMIFGSQYTMSSNYLRDAFEKENIAVISAPEHDQLEIDDFRKLVYSYKENEADVINFQKLIHRHALNATVIIACTELSIFSDLTSNNSNILDLADVQIRKALALMT